MQTKDFDYILPPELIAQQPAPERTQARLMLVNRATAALQHYRVADLPALLQPHDLMILNDTRVIPARVFGRKQKTGGKAETLFIAEREENVWEAFLHAAGRPKVGDILLLANEKVKARVRALCEDGRVMLEISCAGDFSEILEEEGLPPLPPYIRRPADDVRCRKHDYERYQTVYAKIPGAIAAPTAGLHFTTKLLARLEEQSIQITKITLHVGPGTFIPVRCGQIKDHKMEAERFIIEEPAARTINEAGAEKRRIIAVGTTVARALEAAADSAGKITAGSGSTNLFIYPPYRFKVVKALLTNFHLPRSTLLMLVSAFAGRELIRQAYEAAIRGKYRFYSYGDCMLIL